MKTLRTEIDIAAPPQTVWSILDDLERYRDWNKVLPRVDGRTTVGETLQATIAFPGTAPNAFAPALTRIVGARELRWLTAVPGDQGYSAEHYFVLTPTPNGGTRLEHCEAFDGALRDIIWPMMDTVGRQAYEDMNVALTVCAEKAVATPVRLQLIASQCGVSVRTLTRSFKATTGRTISGVFAEARIRRAMALLEDGSLPLKTVASRVGFANASSFLAAFRRVTGMTPGALRAELANGRHPSTIALIRPQ